MRILILLLLCFMTAGMLQGLEFGNELMSLALEGDADAQFEIGYCYDAGEGVAQNKALAVTWYKLSANQGNSDAQNNLAVCYENGDGVEQSYALALYYYEHAANLGNANAQNNLGLCYLEGIVTDQDYQAAYKWFLIANAFGFAVSYVKQGAALEHLTDEQIAEAESDACDWVDAYNASEEDY